ncbi:MAG: hypothetical protein KGL39_35050 [Patescibacteria group bacterium]|nr:hypothetical protein [Patescibacteria group bacterium]
MIARLSLAFVAGFVLAAGFLAIALGGCAPSYIIDYAVRCAAQAANCN